MAAAVSLAPTKRSVDRFFEYSLLGMLVCGYLAVLSSGFVPAPLAVIVGACIAVRVFMVAGWVRYEPGPRSITAITLAYICFYPIDYFFISDGFLEATVHLLFFLAVVKVLSAKTERDFTYVKLIAFMELLAASILSASPLFFLFLAFFLLFALATFAGTEMRRSASRPVSIVRSGLYGFNRRLSGMVAGLFVGIILMTGGLFFLLPRTARAAFQHLIAPQYHLPGFSNEVVLGKLGEIKRQSTAVMHVRFEENTAMPPLKWRGAALVRFDGRRWSGGNAPGDALATDRGVVPLVDPEIRTRRPGRRFWYDVQLKDIAGNTLFFAGTPEMIQIRVPFIYRTPAQTFRLAGMGSNGLSYSAQSLFDDQDPAGRSEPGDLPTELVHEYTRLPEIDGRIPVLARQLTEPYPTIRTKARAIEDYFRTKFGYTLELLPEEVSDPLAHFLFVRKKGHCEYFASAMAVMLRSLGVPARVVTGFQGGLRNPVNGWYVVRASDAHSWVEAWLPERGWTTFDPTPPDPNMESVNWMTQIGFYLDAAEVFWQDWVLNYDLDRQATLANRVEESSRRLSWSWAENSAARLTAQLRNAATVVWNNVAGVLLTLGILIALVLAAPGAIEWLRVRQRAKRLQSGQGSASDATLLYLRMLALLKKRGVEKPGWLTPNEFASVLPDQEIGVLVRDLTVAYNEVRFGSSTDAAPRMVALLEQLETRR
jgi:transglutaminase-like putative cysteine protease